jgi:predicted transposase YbfD/YdcC
VAEGLFGTAQRYSVPRYVRSGFFSQISPDAFEQAFVKWVAGVVGVLGEQVVAIDGKTLRRSHDRSSGKAAIHMVSAWASETRLVLGQVRTQEKSNEITAIPELLKLLDIKGCIVTIDAMGCQKSIADSIRKQDADYVLSLKGNHDHLHNDVRLIFENAAAKGFSGMPHSYVETFDKDHGRIEIRRHWTTPVPEWLALKTVEWTGLTSVNGQVN